MNIRRQTTLLLFAIVPALALVAQDTPGFRFGLTVAPNTASFRVQSDELKADGTRTSWSYGALGDFRLGQGDHWAIHSGLLITNIGGGILLDANVDRGTGPTIVTGHLDLRMTYLEIPLALKFRTTTPGPWDVYALAGGSGAFVLKSRADGMRTLATEGTTGTTTTYDNTSIDSDIAFFKTSVIVGAGVEYSLPAGTTLFAGIRYSAALSNTLGTDAGAFITDSDRTQIYPDFGEISLGLYF
jgi:hypothetical protein